MEVEEVGTGVRPLSMRKRLAIKAVTIPENSKAIRY